MALNQLIRPGRDFSQLFSAFEHTAFRLESRDSYDAQHENESVRKFLTGEDDDLPWIQPWLTRIREHVAAGRRFSRVRVVSLPLSDYSRFGLWCSQHNSEAGEDIRYLTRPQADIVGLPDYDYWLLDSLKLVRMHFDHDRFVGGEIINDPAVVVQHNYWRDAAWHKAIRRDEFAAEYHT